MVFEYYYSVSCLFDVTGLKYKHEFDWYDGNYDCGKETILASY